LVNFSCVIIDSFQDKVGEQGTLIIPAFNHNLRSFQKFDLNKTKPVTGTLSIACFNRKDFKRTKHPLHSFMVWGKHADYLSNMNNQSSFGKDSPFAFLKDKNSKMLLISTGVAEALTFAHFVEETEKVRYRKYKTFKIFYTDEDGETSLKQFLLYKKKPGWDLNFKPIEKILKNSILKEKSVNNIKIQMLNLADAYLFIQKDIRENNAKSLAYFSKKLFVRDIIKDILHKFNIFSSAQDKITNQNKML
jgi:aminoglycoside 3-N-acetyltransferase